MALNFCSGMVEKCTIHHAVGVRKPTSCPSAFNLYPFMFQAVLRAQHEKFIEADDRVIHFHQRTICKSNAVQTIFNRL